MVIQNGIHYRHMLSYSFCIQLYSISFLDILFICTRWTNMYLLSAPFDIPISKILMQRSNELLDDSLWFGEWTSSHWYLWQLQQWFSSHHCLSQHLSSIWLSKSDTWQLFPSLSIQMVWEYKTMLQWSTTYSSWFLCSHYEWWISQ